MNSIHDMGGMDGFGPVEPEPNEPPFHAPWEGRVLALQRATGALGAWAIDHARASVEAIDPATYLRATYYEKWFIGLQSRLRAYGFVDEDELAAGRSLRPGKPVKRVMTPAMADTMLRSNYSRPATKPPSFTPGDRVRTRNLNPVTHTRLPRYARDKVGVVEANRGCHVYPDAVAIDAGEQPQWLYTVVFSARELWGDDADPNLTISIDAFEPYLVHA